MALVVWEWEIDDMAMDEDELREYRHQKNVEWWAANKGNPERKRRNNEASRQYRNRQLEADPESYLQRRREITNKSQQKYYSNKRAAMTEEELEEYRRVTRERVRAIRARKKAEKLSQASKTENE